MLCVVEFAPVSYYSAEIAQITFQKRSQGKILILISLSLHPLVFNSIVHSGLSLSLIFSVLSCPRLVHTIVIYVYCNLLTNYTCTVSKHTRHKISQQWRSRRAYIHESIIGEAEDQSSRELLLVYRAGKMIPSKVYTYNS